MIRVSLYGAGWCGFTHRARALLELRGVEFEFFDLDSRPDLRETLFELSGNWTVPQILIDGEPIGGYSELARIDRDGGLERLAA